MPYPLKDFQWLPIPWKKTKLLTVALPGLSKVRHDLTIPSFLTLSATLPCCLLFPGTLDFFPSLEHPQLGGVPSALNALPLNFCIANSFSSFESQFRCQPLRPYLPILTKCCLPHFLSYFPVFNL